MKQAKKRPNLQLHLSTNIRISTQWPSNKNGGVRKVAKSFVRSSLSSDTDHDPWPLEQQKPEMREICEDEI